MSRDTTIVFVHGSGGDASVWNAQVTHFADTCDVRAIDLPGRRSDAAIVTLSTCVERLRDHVSSLEMPVVVGHSLGAAVALEYALKDPDTVGGLVLIGAAASVDIPERLIDLVRSDLDAALETLPRALLGRTPDQAAVIRLVDQIRRVPVDAFLGDLRTSAEFNFAGRLKSFHAPVLVVQGAEDRVTTTGAGRDLATALGGAFEEIAASGHMVMLEQPDVLNQTIERFLRTLS